MRILLLTQYYAPEVGAAQTRLAAVVTGLVRNGDDVEVVTALPNYPFGRIQPEFRGRLMRTTVESGVRIRRVWMFAAMGTGVRRLASYLSFTTMSMLGLLVAKKPDVILIESPPLFVAIPGLLYSKVRRVPAVFNVADLWPDAAVAVGALPEGRVLRMMLALERWTYRNAGLVSTVTEGVKIRLIDQKGLSPTKVVMLANGVDTELFQRSAGDPAILAELNLPERPFMVYAGTMGLAHGLDHLLDAMTELSDEPDLPYLLMIGSGSERPRLEQIAADRGLPNVRFRDPVPPVALARLLPLALAGVVTSAEIPINDSSRPAKLFPIMSSEIPVLFAGRGEGAQAVREAGAGVVVPNRADEIAAAIRSLTSDEPGRMRMAASGRDAVKRSWSWQKQIDRWRLAVGSLVTQTRR